MDKLELIYDHYKESNSLRLLMQKKREYFFVAVCVVIAIQFLFLIEPSRTTQTISAWLKSNLLIELTFSTVIIQAFAWTIVLYLIIRYFQTNIYIERQYRYIEQLESEISQIVELDIDRESRSYLTKYPYILDAVHFFYTWLFPVIIGIVIVYKIIIEWIRQISIFAGLFDTAVGIFIVILIVLYLLFSHTEGNKSEEGFVE